MRPRDTSFAIVFIVVSYINYSFSLPADFNFNGVIQKVTNLSFNSYFFEKDKFGATNQTSIAESSNPNLKTSDGNNSESDNNNDISENPEVQIDDYNQNNEEQEEEALTLTDAEEKSILFSGIPVDYSFNETLAVNDNPNKLISAPGCPASGEKDDIETLLFSPRSTWVHYGNPPRCYLIGSQGPCRAGMRMGLQANSHVGKCKCKCFVQITKQHYYQIRDQPNLDPYLDEKQSFCFDGEDSHYAMYQEKCYMLLTQGPCKHNEALVLDQKLNEPSCQVRECPEEETENYLSLKHGFAGLQNGMCLKLRDECNNASEARIDKNGPSELSKVLGTTVENPNPFCYSRGETLEFQRQAYSGGRAIRSNDCKKVDQIFSTLLRRCVPYSPSVRGRKEYVG